MKHFFVAFFVIMSFVMSRIFTFCQSQQPGPTEGEPIPTIKPVAIEETSEDGQGNTDASTNLPTITDPAIYNTEDVSNERKVFVAKALEYLGTPYKYASTNASGMDCSGLVYRSALDALDIKLPRSTKTLAEHCTRLSSSQEPQVGDLLFFNTTGSGISHVGIYLGEKNFIHAASSGPRIGVIISSMTETYYKNCFLFYASFLK